MTTPSPDQPAKTLTEFLRQIVPLTPQERGTIIAQAKALLSGYYVHLPFKQERHNVDPIGDLERLGSALPAATDDAAFHGEVCAIFAKLRDLHTQYSLPQSYQEAVAMLPFKLGAYLGDNRTRYIITDVLPTYKIPNGHYGFGVGAEVLTWGRSTMECAVTSMAEQSGGASDAARRARVLASMTIRPMERQPPPDGSGVTITYRPEGGKEMELPVSWQVVEAKLETIDETLHKYVGLDHEGEIRRRVSMRAYHPKVVDAVQRATAGGRHSPYEDDALETSMPSVFRAHPIAGGQFGYIRIFTFNPPIPSTSVTDLLEKFRTEFVTLVTALPQRGLVVDVRGNGGGCLPLAEGLLQTLTDKTITPQPLELLATPEMLAISLAARELAAFVPSLQRAVDQTPPAYSDGVPLTDPAWCRGLDHHYPGKVILIVDARCYSATDAFAAGFQDHDIGTVLGISPATGGGGANVWTLPVFLEFAAAGAFEKLPQGASLRVAFRRTRRVGINAGKLVEEDGVAPDILHTVTRADLLAGDRDLLMRAIAELRK